MWRTGDISIHALLAESDMSGSAASSRPSNFNPRSPCGERLGTQINNATADLFQSTLSLRRATSGIQNLVNETMISIHALLAESDVLPAAIVTLDPYFNPRSPCGERQQIPPNWPYRFCLKCQFKDGEKSKKAKGSASAQASSPAYEKNKVRIPWGDFECFRFAPIK